MVLQAAGLNHKKATQNVWLFSFKQAMMLTFITVQQLLHVRFDAAMPFVLQHTVHHRVAHRAIAAQRVVADDAVFFCAQALYGFLAGKI